MRDLGDVIADLSNARSDDAHLYSGLAPVYDFMYQRHFDYETQLAVVTETLPAGADAVVELGCGTGHLLGLLAEEYGTAVGVERSGRMARRARARTDAEVVLGDATRVGLDGRFDALVALGRVTGHFADDGAVDRFASNCDAALRPGGTLLFDYFPAERMEDDHRTAETFESEAYRVERRTHSTIPDPDGRLVETAFDYELFDRETGDSATVSETMRLRMFDAGEVRARLRNAGFAAVDIREEGADGWPLAVARRPERND